jgi:predicted N-acetyltransferase YhbS
MDRLTDVIHAGYARLGSDGLRFWGTHQSVADTRTRCAEGQCFVAVQGAHIVGTVTIKPTDPSSEVEVYRDPSTWCLTQFAVLPELHGLGLGRGLHDMAVAEAREHGARRIALDTAEPATHLIAMYRRWGYELVGTCDWRPFTNYQSVVMVKEVMS